ncbi:MAG: hypothetical protein ACREV3_04045 [Gammaproteobacteria bacterium]
MEVRCCRDRQLRLPGALVKVGLEGAGTGAGTLGDPFLGFFDSACNLVSLDDDGGGNLNSRLVITVPADGLFVLGVTRCCDGSFSEGGFGSYRLTIAPFAVIGSIGGQVLDAVTGDALPGDTDPFAFVELRRCDAFGCFFINGVSADSVGRYLFSVDSSGQPLEVGTYQIAAFANEYQPGQSEPFDVGEGEDRTVDIALELFPLQASEIRPCGSLPPEGGSCAYSVRLTNRSGTALDGAAWSIVSSFGIGSLADFTLFQTANPQRLNLRPGASKVVRFEFQVPPTVRDGAFICADLFAGQDRRRPFFNTVVARNLFCIEKGFRAFSVMSEKEAQRLFRQRHAPAPSRKEK